MKAIVLAAGQGTRMRPLSATVPKPMLPVAGQPLVAHTLDAAIDAGAEELILVVGYEADVIRTQFGTSRQGVPINYAVQHERNGTAGAVAATRQYLEGPFAVLNGDTLYDPETINRLFSSGPAIVTATVDNPQNYGVVEVADDVVTTIVEKPDDPPSNLVNAGGYVFPAIASEWLDVAESERGEREITDVLARVIEEYDVTPVVANRWMDVGRPWELLEANEWKLGELERRIDGDVSEDAHLEGAVVVEAGATVKPGALIEGPALIRSGASVGPNAYVRGATLIGENVSIGNAVEIKNSVLSQGTSVSHLSYVGDSVLGRNVNFGAGTTVANLRHDDDAIDVMVKGECVSTGRRKLGVIVGDGVKTGINTSLYPGVKLSSEATTRPGEVINRDR